MEFLLPKKNSNDCKICKDFKQWTKETSKTLSQPNVLPEELPLMRTTINSQGEKIACPPNKEELGRTTWTFLHTMAAYYPEKVNVEVQESMSQFLRQLSRIYPCDYCAQHLRYVIEQNPPTTDSQHNLSQWLCEFHNQVNEICGKPTFDCRKLNERWRDGPSDGSCD
jgi:FAD-linked sulfhydryl oxidase